jgi:hypothetical protein
MMIVYLLNLFCRERKNQTGVRRTIPECSGQESKRNGRNEENVKFSDSREPSWFLKL